MDEAIIKSSGNVFTDLGFPEEEAELLAIHSHLMIQLEKLIEKHHWTPIDAARHLNISQSRVSDLVQGKWEKFSLDMLLTLAIRAGLHPRLALDPLAA